MVNGPENVTPKAFTSGVEVKGTVSINPQVVSTPIKMSTQGFENKTDFLTQNAASVLGIEIPKGSVEDNQIAGKTNEILASLGYEEYKVSAPQVASVANGIKTVVEPGLKLAQDGAVAARIQDPDGPFTDVFV